MANSSINNNTQLDDLKAHPGVFSVYASRVQLKKEGKEWASRCPFHQEKTASFKLFYHNGILVWRCFGQCAVGGDVISFIQKIENCSFKEAVDKLKLDLKDSFAETRKADTTFSSLSGLDAPAKTYPISEYKKLEFALTESQPAKDWLSSRGITLETAQKLHVGFRQVIKSSKPEHADIISSGWICFPCIEGDKVTAIKYRSIVKKEFSKQTGMAKGDQTPLFNSETIEALEPVYLVEGECDAAVLEQAGFRSASIQSAGTPLTPANKEKLLESDYILLAGDNDPAGNDYMNKVWREIGERTYKLTWPTGYKDANQVYLDLCKSDLLEFRRLVEDLTLEAKSQPMPGISSLQEAMMAGVRVDLEDHPSRLRFPWKAVDKMVNLLPGTVLYIFATQTGTGKTTFVSNLLTQAARSGEVVINYSAELTADEYANLVAAHVLKKDRNSLTKEDYQHAAKVLGDARFYIGRNADLYKADDVIDLIEAAVRRLSGTVVCLDHIHYVIRNEVDTIKAQENIMKRIKNLAVKYGLKWINVGQPRKPNQQNKGKIVHLTDSKGGECVYSDADAVLALHRDLAMVDNPNNPPKEPFQPLTQVHLMKGRSQGTGNAYTELMFNGSFATFYEVAKDIPEKEGLFA